MTLVVEVGVGLENAESYDTIENIAAYAVKVGKAFPITGADGPATAAAVAAAEAAARRATAALDGKYADRFAGKPTHVDQALEWPRTGVCYRGEEMTDDWIPKRLKEALAESAILELATPGVMAASLQDAGRIKRKRERVDGAVEEETEWIGAGVAGENAFNAIDAILVGLLGAKSGPALFGYLVRA